MKERRQIVMGSVLQVFSGLTDMVGVVSVLPFLSVAADPGLLQSNTLLARIQNWTGYSNENFLILLGMMSLGALILNQTMRIGSSWYLNFISHQIWWHLHRRMFHYYLNQPYAYHIQHSSTLLLEKLQVRINAVVAGVIQPVFLLLSSFFCTAFILSLLISTEPVLTLSLLGVISTFYLLVYQKIKAKLDFFGAISPEFSRKSFKLIAESLGAVKEIKVRRNGQFYLDLFDPLAKRYCDSQVRIQLFAEVPAGLVEVMAFEDIVCYSVYDFFFGLQQAIPLLAMYSLALRRILPAVQEAQADCKDSFHEPSLQVVYDDMKKAISSPIVQNIQKLK